jgi:glycine hydroxymethyltransferase
MDPGDTILAMDLSHGGHLTHGSPVSHMGRLFRFVRYRTEPEREMARRAEWIVAALRSADDATALAALRSEVEALCEGFPVPGIDAV